MFQQGTKDIEVYDPGGGGKLPAHILDDATRQRLGRLVDDGTPPNTKRAYSGDLRYFWAWCSAIGWTDAPTYPVPTEVIARFVVDHLEGLASDVDHDLIERGVKARLGTHSISTIDRRIAALSSAHKTKGFNSPCTDPSISQLLSKARKAAARRGHRAKKKKAIIKSMLDAMLETCEGKSKQDIRDASIILFGWASGGRRRSEIVNAVMEDLEPVGDDYLYHLDVTKTSQEGDGGTVPISGRAARALQEWIDISGIHGGPIFRSIDRHGNISDKPLSDRSIALIVKSRARQAELNPDLFAGHSLRSGFLTEAGLQGKSLLEAMALSRHKTVQVAAGYHQSGAALNNETAQLAG